MTAMDAQNSGKSVVKTAIGYNDPSSTTATGQVRTWKSGATTYTYAYDARGNIQSKTEYAYMTGSLGAAQNRTYLKNFKSYPLKTLLSEEEGRETETLCLLSVYTASWSSVP